MKKVIMMMIVAVFAATSLFSAGQAESSTTDDGRTEVVFYMWEDPTYVQIVEAFNESQDEIFVRAEVLGSSDYEARLTTLLAGGAEMDAFMQKRQVDMFGHWANGHIMPLDDLIDQFDYDYDAVSAYDSALRVDGQIAAIPFRGATYYTYYNRNAFDAAGVDYPSEYVERGEWTWDTFQEVARAVTTDEVEGAHLFTWGLKQAVPAIQNQVDFITQDGEIDIDDSVLYSYRMRRELEEAGAMTSLLELKATRQHYSDLFFRGDVAMMIIGEWFPGMMMDARDRDALAYEFDEWGITRLPSFDPDNYRSIGAPTFNHVHANARNPEAAFEFIAWMGSPEGAQVVAEAGFLPPLITPEVEEALRGAMPDDQSFEYFVEGPPVYPPHYTRYGTRVDQVLGEMMEDYLLSDWSDEEFMDEFRSRLEDIVSTTD